MFLRKTKPREPLPITMTGVRMGERLLQVGIDDPRLAGAIAVKVGLSGAAAMAVVDDAGAARAQAAADEAGALIDITITPLEKLPYPDASFDVIVVHAMRTTVGPAAGLPPDTFKECLRALRAGGRIVVITPGPKSGLATLLRAAPVDAGADSVASALNEAGFRPVRVVGELEGYRFTEGLTAKS